MADPADDLPDSFRIPPLPAALDVWFEMAATRDESTEVISSDIDDGAILDDLGVVDEASARLALVGYRWTLENRRWIDQAQGGHWSEDWIVLDSVNADPLIADISAPGVPVLTARHGEGRWAPVRVADTVAEFVAALDVNAHVDGPPPIYGPLPEWSVWAIDLGPAPLRTLVALGGHPLFRDFTRTELLELRTRLPARLDDGLTYDGARACVEFGTRHGAVFEARTYERTAAAASLDVDVDALFDGPAGDDEYTEPAPSDQLIASVEAELGFRLPDAYLALAVRRNGGRLARGAHPMTEATSWADDHIAVTGISAIGRTSRYALAGDLGAAFMRDEWGYPEWGIVIADTPSAGHDAIMLDYRTGGEPRVVHVDQEQDYRVTEVAPDLATFLAGLVDEDEFDDSDPAAEKAADLERVATGSLSPIVTEALAAAPGLAFGEAALRELGRRIVERHGFFSVRDDDDSRLLLDAMFLLHSRVASAGSLGALLDPEGETSYENPSLPLMLFFSISDEPFGFRTGGYAPGFVEEWWDGRVREDALHEGTNGCRFTAEAEAQLTARLRSLAG